MVVLDMKYELCIVSIELDSFKFYSSHWQLSPSFLYYCCS